MPLPSAGRIVPAQHPAWRVPVSWSSP